MVCFTEKFYVHHSFATRKYQTIKLQTTEVSFQEGSYALSHKLKMSIPYNGVTKYPAFALFGFRNLFGDLSMKRIC